MNSNNQPVILVVDDIKTNIVLVQVLLRGKNYEVLSAQSGVQALKIAEERKPDIIILDLMMPVMDGYEVLARLRANEATKDIKIIVLSALAKSEDIKRAMSLGADDFLTKPIVAPKFFEVLNKLTGSL